MLDPWNPPSAIRRVSGGLRIRCTGIRPFYSGFFFLAIFGPMNDHLFKGTYSCDFYSAGASELEVVPGSGDLRARELFLTFTPGRSIPANRRFFRGGKFRDEQCLPFSP